MSISPLANSNQMPDEDQLWMFEEIFRNEWTTGVTVSSEYKTDVQSALTQAEQRYGLMDRPIRSMAVRFMAGGRDLRGGIQSARHSAVREASALRAIAQRYSVAKSLWPLFSDESFLTSAVSSTDLTVPCDTENIRFTAGFRALIVSGPTSERADGPYYDKGHTVEIVEIASVGSGQLLLSSGLSNDYPAGSRIFPLFEARLIFSLQGNVITDSMVDLTITAIEEVGSTQLPGTKSIGNAIGFDTYQGLPIFDPDIDYAEDPTWGFVRRGQRSDAGLSGYPVAYGSRGLAVFGFYMNHLSREDAFETIRFFDSRGGRQHPFWLLSPLEDYYDFSGTLTIPGQGVKSAVLRAPGSSIDWTMRPYIFFKKPDGTVYIREIDSVLTGADDIFTITMVDALPESLEPNEVSRVGIAYMARFDQDAIEEAWSTSETMGCPLSIIELEQEKTITIADISEIVTTDLLISAVQGDCSGSSFLLYPCSGCGRQLTVCDSPNTGAIRVARTEWAANTSYTRGQYVYRPGAGANSTEIYLALNDGTSGNTEPSWIDDCGESFFDNDIEWERSDFIYGIIELPVTCEWDMPAVESAFSSCSEAAADQGGGYTDAGPPTTVDEV